MKTIPIPFKWKGGPLPKPFGRKWSSVKKSQIPGQSASHFRVNLRLKENIKIIIIDCCNLNAKMNVHCLQSWASFFMWKKELQYLVPVRRAVDTKANFYGQLKSSENCSKPGCLPSIVWAAFHQNAVRVTLLYPKFGFGVSWVITYMNISFSSK